METGHDDAVVTLAAIADGTVSLYFSNGGGMIGLGEHEEVRKVSNDFISLSEQFITNAKLTSAFPLPGKYNTIFYFLTFDGVYITEELEEDILGNNKSPFSPLFHKAHDVITQARLADEKGR